MPEQIDALLQIADSATTRRAVSAYSKRQIAGFGLICGGTPVAIPGATMSPMPGHEEIQSTPGVKLTYDDFLLFPDDGNRHELIDGEHYVTPSPNTAHQRIVGRLHLALGGYLEKNPVGELFLAPFDVVFSQFDVVEPDLLYITAERRKEILTTQHVRGTPDVVIEVGSPGTRRRDETIKRRLYERAGVAEYWTVDPELEVVRIYRRVGDGFGRAHELSHDAGDVLSSTLFPGFDLPLLTIFRSPE